MATHSSVLAWRIPGTGEPGGLPSTELHRVGHDWSDLAAAAAARGFLGSRTFRFKIRTLPAKLWSIAPLPGADFYYFFCYNTNLSRVHETDIWFDTEKPSQIRSHSEARGAKTSTYKFHSVQLNSVAQSCLTLCNPMNRSTPGFPVHHQLLESTQTHVHRVGDAIQPSHPLLSPSPPALNLSQHQGLFQWVSSSHQVAKVLEFQLQHQSFQRTPRNDLL